MTQGIKVERGDLVISGSTGRPVTIQDTVKLRQDVRQAIDEAGLQDLIGQPFDIYALRAEVSTRLFASMQNLQALQRSIQFSDRTQKEIFAQIASLEVYPTPAPTPESADPTSISFTVGVISAYRELINTSLVIV